MTEKGRVIEKIIEIELSMFLAVPVERKTSSKSQQSCSQKPEDFRLHRKAQFIPWSIVTLKSYLNDLRIAFNEGRNLMTEKYARMDNLIPRNNYNPLIEKITSVQYEWQKEMFKRFPHFMGSARALSQADDSSGMTSFETYLRCELETYSDSTLSHLFKDVQIKLEQGENMSRATYEYLIQQLGYASLEAYENTYPSTF
jgi:hypothetical protein